MNRTRLKEAEERFFSCYPGGFSHPLMQEKRRKHKVEKMNTLARESFALEQFEDPKGIVDSMGMIISRSSIVSVFEKPKFKDLIKCINEFEKERLALGLKEFLHGDQKGGFELMCGLLGEYRLAKWTLLTACPAYYDPAVEVFIKPTTVKNVIDYFELDGLKYSSKPTFEFYKSYREQINMMKRELDASMQRENTAFCGFLMMAVESSK